jgi:Uma2 family endonuclease
MRRLSIGEYHRMIEAAVFDEDEHVELLEGVIVRVSPQGTEHATVIERLNDPRFVELPAAYLIRCQLPLSLSDADEPEPDIAVIARDVPRSRKSHPASACLVFEVANESIRKDRQIKAPLYARAAVAEYVIVNLAEQRLEVHRSPDPASGRYRTLETLDATATFVSESVPGLKVPLAKLFS